MEWTKRGRPRIKARTAARMDMGGSYGSPAGGASPMLPEVETRYAAASRRARDMASWPAWRISPDAALLPEQDAINARIEDLTRNNGIARSARRTLVDNVIGPRVTCKPNPDQHTIGRPLSPDWQRTVQGEWETFADTTWFDAGGRHTFHSATRLAVNSLASNGEALALPTWIQGNGRGTFSRWFTCLQMVHPARLSNPDGRSDDINIRGGIELNERGEPIAYNIEKTHPGDTARGLALREWETIPAYQTWGRVRVIHLYDQEDVGLTRGVSALASVLRQFAMLDKFSTERLRLAVLDSLMFAALETPLDSQGVQELFGEPGEANPMGAYYEALQEWQVNMRGGALIPIPPGTTMKPFMPPRGMSELEPFSVLMLRNIAAGLDYPYELLTKDFSKTNYSSARAALLEAWRTFQAKRQLVIDHWIRPIYDLWFEEAVNRGRIPECTPADYYNNQVAWTRAKWLFAPRGWVDPLKEARGVQIRKDAGITTLEDLAGEQGMDWVDMLEQQARENERADLLGVPRPHVAKKAAPGAGADAGQNLQDAADIGGDE
jgi:lambda family phage portal protein